MTLDCAEQLGFDAAWAGNTTGEPHNLPEWVEYPEYLAAWVRGWQRWMDWK